MVIYKTVNLLNGKAYIGKDKFNKPSYYGSGKGLIAAIEKYGKENFRKEILEVCDSYEHMNEREVYWINYHNAVEDRQFYNMREGGDGGVSPQCLTEEFREKMKVVNQDNRMHGKTHSEEAREKQRKAAVGRYTLQWFIDRYGEAEGTHRYNERSRKRSDATMGKNNPFYGKTFKYEEHPRYTNIPQDELQQMIKDRMSGPQIAKHFNTTTTTICAKVKRYWGYTFTEAKRYL